MRADLSSAPRERRIDTTTAESRSPSASPARPKCVTTKPLRKVVLATPAMRFFASIVDLAVSFVVVVAVVVGAWTPWGLDTSQDRRDTLIHAMRIADGLVFHVVVPWITDGYTVGNYVMGIRIVRLNGQTLSVWCLVLRILLNVAFNDIASVTVLVLSGLLIVWRADRRSMHDLFADTTVAVDGAAKVITAELDE